MLGSTRAPAAIDVGDRIGRPAPQFASSQWQRHAGRSRPRRRAPCDIEINPTVYFPKSRHLAFAARLAFDRSVATLDIFSRVNGMPHGFAVPGRSRQISTSSRPAASRRRTKVEVRDRFRATPRG